MIYDEYIEINEDIKVKIPLMSEILKDKDSEQNYYTLVSIITASPNDYKVMLDDNGIDYSKIDDYTMFLLLSGMLSIVDTSMLFGDFSFQGFEQVVNTENGQTMLVKAILDDKAEDGVKYIVIDKLIHSQIANTVRLINGMKKNTIKSGNEENTKYQIEKERKKLKRNRKKKQESQLDPLILALVNTEEFKYNFNQIGRASCRERVLRLV